MTTPEPKGANISNGPDMWQDWQQQLLAAVQCGWQDRMGLR